MNFQTYKVFEKVNGFYYYIVSHIDDNDFNLDVIESYADDNQEDPKNVYFAVVGFDNLDIAKCPEVSPIQVINKSFASDSKNMAVSEEYKKVLEEMIAKIKEAKKPKGKKSKPDGQPTEAKPKKEPKPRAKKEATKKVVIEQPTAPVNFN